MHETVSKCWISPGDSVQEEYGPFALNGDISTDFHQTLVFIMLGVEFLLEYCQRMKTKQYMYKTGSSGAQHTTVSPLKAVMTDESGFIQSSALDPASVFRFLPHPSSVRNIKNMYLHKQKHNSPSSRSRRKRRGFQMNVKWF